VSARRGVLVVRFVLAFLTGRGGLYLASDGRVGEKRQLTSLVVRGEDGKLFLRR